MRCHKLKPDRIYRNILNTIDDGVLLFNSDNEIIDVNESFLNLFGYKRSELTDFSLYKMFSVIDKENKYLEELYGNSNSKNIYNVNSSINNKKGREIPVQIKIFTIKENNSTNYKCIIFKEKYEILKAENKSKKIVESLSDEIYVVDENNVEEIIKKNQKSVYNFFNKYEKEKIKDAVSLVIRRHKKISLHTSIIRKTKEFFQINIVHIMEGEALVIIKDVTLQKNALNEKSTWNIFYNNLSLTIKDVLSSDLNENSYQKILDYAVASIPDIDGGSVVEKRNDGLYHFIALTENYDRNILMNITLKPGELVGEESDTIQIKEDIESLDTSEIIEDEKFNKLNESHTTKKVLRAVISIPILLSNKRMYIFLDSFTVGKFTPEVVKMGKIFAQQIEVLVKRLSLEKEIKKQLHQLEYFSYNDPLTNLPNRRAFFEKIHKIIESEDFERINIVYFDLDGFKLINDNFGHEFGDLVLRKIGDYLIQKIDESIFFARIGGDEFIAYFLNYSIEDIKRIIGEVIKKIENIKAVIEKGLRVSASYGISTYNKESVDINDLIIKADQNMYRQKNRKKAHQGTHNF